MSIAVESQQLLAHYAFTRIMNERKRREEERRRRLHRQRAEHQRLQRIKSTLLAHARRHTKVSHAHKATLLLALEAAGKKAPAVAQAAS